MKQKRSLPGVVMGAALILLFLGLPAGFAAGSLRYGGPEGLLLRIRAQIAERQPHPEFVPTPFTAAAIVSTPQATAQAATAATDLPASPAAANPAPAAASEVQSATAASAGVAGSQTLRALGQSPAATPTVARSADPATPSPVPPSSPTAAAFAAARPQVSLTGITHLWQTWNNCGPATLTMDLGYYGSKLSQADVAAALKPDKDDKNVNPDEMVAFARSQGLEAIARANGDPGRLRTLLSNGVPVIVETWLEPKPNDGMGHFRLLTGYDDARREWTAYDSYVSTGVDPKVPYAGIRLSYDELDPLWAVFNDTYVVVYPKELAPIVSGILGADSDDATMWQAALARAQAAAGSNPKDAFAAFNLGSDLTALGRYAEAAAAYDQARRIGLPWRMLWYQFGPFKAYYWSGRYQEVIALADATQKLVGNIEELYYWKGMALAATGDRAGARAAWQRAIQCNPNYRDPAEALANQGQ